MSGEHDGSFGDERLDEGKTNTVATNGCSSEECGLCLEMNGNWNGRDIAKQKDGAKRKRAIVARVELI